ncbi:hypothetical protein KFK09_009928 [Dendrobium nobile]|uniref:Uncharacterized protein n=1 Tax=Dendrobium nobile TaxID=94219 RepID=A0A8T3BNZ7_DENNO|nr:hypothetical protein KFK09_009928 [Dendrobium nobile]
MGFGRRSIRKGGNHLYFQQALVVASLKMLQLPIREEGSRPRERSRNSHKEPEKDLNRRKLTPQPASSCSSSDQNVATSDPTGRGRLRKKGEVATSDGLKESESERVHNKRASSRLFRSKCRSFRSFQSASFCSCFRSKEHNFRSYWKGSR